MKGHDLRILAFLYTKKELQMLKLKDHLICYEKHLTINYVIRSSEDLFTQCLKLEHPLSSVYNVKQPTNTYVTFLIFMKSNSHRAEWLYTSSKKINK